MKLNNFSNQIVIECMGTMHAASVNQCSPACVEMDLETRVRVLAPICGIPIYIAYSALPYMDEKFVLTYRPYESPDKIVERTIGHKVRGSQSPYHCLSFVQVQFTISLRRIVKYDLLHGEMFFPKFNECSSTELLLYTIIYRYFV